MKKRFIWTALLGAVLAVSLVACAPAQNNATGKLPDTIRIANQPCVCLAPNILAIKKGWMAEAFQKHGVKLDVKVFDNGPNIGKALLGDGVDIAGYGTIPQVALIATGGDIDIFYVSDREDTTEGLVAKKDSGIKSVADLVGKRVGVPSGGTPAYGFRSALDQAGVKYADVEVINLAPPAFPAAGHGGTLTRPTSSTHS